MAFITKPVLTVDIVEFSKRSGRDQMIAIQALIQLLHKAIPEQQNHPSKRIWSPAGDGGALTFWEDIHVAIETAVALGKYIDQYNQGELILYDARNRELPRCEKMPLQVRMGLHDGPVSKETDFDDRENVWGNGLNMSARVASLAKPGQIVASHDYYVHAELEGHPEYEVTPIGKWWAKHNMSVILYNIYKDGVGIKGTEVGEWFEPFQYPLQLATGTYSAMAEEEVKSGGRAFRVLVLAKRLLDLNPQHQRAKEMIEAVSVVNGFRRVGERTLYDDFFSRLSPSALLYFFQNARFVDFKKGNVIFEQGSRADSMMMVVSGEIELFLGGQRIPNVILKEGDIIGEMGLFNPEGEKRTATLKASKNTITLSLVYDFLRPKGGARASECEEIRAQIWRYYRNRTSQNLIYTHRLFKSLSVMRRNELLKRCQFLPTRHNEPIQLDADDVWNNYWIVVAEGRVIVHTKDGKRVEFEQGDCLGPVRLAVNLSPYSKIEVSPNTYLVRLPWKIIKEFLSELKTFRDNCALEGFQARERLGVEF
jgi:CRP-like cAMP-binding protein